MASGRANFRFVLAADSAPILEAFAAHLEQEYKMQPQPSIWFDRPKGWLKSVALSLSAVLFRDAKVCSLVKWAWDIEQPIALDLLSPQANPDEANWPEPVRHAVAVLRHKLISMAMRRKVVWAQATLTLGNKFDYIHPDDTWAHWELETATPFARLDSWLNDASCFQLGGENDWISFNVMPFATEHQRGPERCTGYFGEDAPMLQWRSKSRQYRIASQYSNFRNDALP